ncbi:MAG: MobF family relaxase [Acidimicrobiales bacterium]
MTPLGSGTGRPIDDVIDDVVRYLRDTTRTMTPAPVPAFAAAGAAQSTGSDATAGARRYYADSGDGPGQWRGLGAASLGLTGEVDDEAFARVLSGKHPHTGQPLLQRHPTRGSTARVADVLDGDAADQVSLADAARLTGLSAQYLRRVCSNWEQRRDQIEATMAAGQRPTVAYLICTRTDHGSYRVTREELAAFLIRRRPPTVRIGFDVTLTTEKSLGLLGLLGPPQVRTAVLDAIAVGNATGLDHLEQHAAWARARGRRVGVTGWTVASFRHLTSRALDPFPHHHNVVANLVTDEHGDVRALDGRGLYHYARDASTLATVELRHRLTATLGVDWEGSPTGTWEIAGIPHDAVREFSRRANEIAEAVHELEADTGRGVTIDELRRVVTATRPAKQHTDPDQLDGQWWERAFRAGLTPETLAGCLGRRAPTVVDDDARTRLFTHLASPEGVTKHHSTFTRGDVLAAIANHSERINEREQLWVLPVDQVVDLAEQFLASERALRLARTQRRPRDVIRRSDGRFVDCGFHDPEFSTPEVVAAEERILANYQRRRARGVAVVSTEVVEATLARFDTLSDEQRQLVRALTASGHGVQCAIGHPGAGKTYAVRAAAAAWTAAGLRVVGAAVKGDAARHLATEAGIPTETLAWYLAHNDPDRLPLDARTVLVVDEAGTIGDRDLDRLLAMADTAGAAIRLVGDPHQHGAVTAGGMFTLLAGRHPDDTPELTSGRRVAHPGDWAAAAALRSGRVAEALALLADAGHLHVTLGPADAYLQVLERWWTSRQAGTHHPMVDRRNMVRRSLNDLAHRLLQAAGELGGEEVLAAEGRRFSTGDHVIARRGERTLHPTGRSRDYIRNGATGTIIELHPGSESDNDVIVVDFTELGVIELPRSFFDLHATGDRLDVGLDHAYAVTSYAVQGRTFPESTSIIDNGTSHPEAYVDITRGQHANHLYLTRRDEPDRERLPRLPQQPIAAQITARLTASGPETPAIELDPLIGQASRIADGHRLAALRAERQRLEASGADITAIARAERLTSARLAWAARRDPPPEIAAVLPPRPDEPHRRRRWETAVATAAVYRARWSSPSATDAWGRLLDHIPSDAQQAHHRNKVIRHLESAGAVESEAFLRGMIDHGNPARSLS